MRVMLNRDAADFKWVSHLTVADGCVISPSIFSLVPREGFLSHGQDLPQLSRQAGGLLQGAAGLERERIWHRQCYINYPTPMGVFQ
jgi:hypothetical protein